MADLNNYQIIGRLITDVDFRSTMTGTPVSTFKITTKKKFRQQGRTQDKVLFLDCISWNRTGELISEHCAKGDEAYFQGELENRDDNGYVIFNVFKVQFIRCKKKESLNIIDELQEKDKSNE